MTSFSLSLASALIAFSPTLSLLFLFTYSKAQLVIIVTTSSFFQLLACLLASLLHLPFKGVQNVSTKDIFVVIPTSVISQAFFRCAFVYCYHKVEAVIENSIQRHEQQARQPLQSQHHNGSADSSAPQDLSETTKLKLELNDASAGVAAGVGFGFFHTVMLYGTLLASENSRVGTLYQDSCTVMPSIFNSALMAFCFGILDLVWMPLTFYGMRRLKDSLSRRSRSNVFGSSSRNEDIRQMQDWVYQKDKLGGKAALALVLFTHFAAAFATLPNQVMPVNGCVLALPLLGFITILTGFAFWYFCKNNYLPREQQQRIQLARRHVD
jgi:Aph-1 protein.